MEEQKKLDFASWLRVFGVLLILLCHFTQESSSVLLNLSAQFFNVGTHVFLMLSGFLFGRQGNCTESPLRWYKKRIKRIYLPYEMMVCALFVIHLLTKQDINLVQWALQFLGLQGWNGVLGAGHTWFVTSIMICYLVTPLIAFVLDRGNETINFTGVAVVALMLPVVLSISMFDSVALLLMPLSSYVLGYVLGKRFEKVQIGGNTTLLSISVMAVAMGVRLLGRQLFDGTLLYTNIIVTYTQIAIALAIFMIFAVVFKNYVPVRCVRFFDGISFEVYLWHYMFTVGPIRLFGLTGYWIFDCIVVMTIVVIVASVANRLCKIVAHQLKFSWRKQVQV